MASSLRKALEGAFRRHRASEALVPEIMAILRAHGLVLRRGWDSSRLAPSLAGIWERSLSDPSLAAFMACVWMEQEMGLDLVRRNLLAGDERVLAWLRRTTPSPR